MYEGFSSLSDIDKSTLLTVNIYRYVSFSSLSDIDKITLSNFTQR